MVGSPSILSGQIIATSHDLTPNGGLVREIPLFQGNPGWWNIIIWPDSLMAMKKPFGGLAHVTRSIKGTCQNSSRNLRFGPFSDCWMLIVDKKLCDRLAVLEKRWWRWVGVKLVGCIPLIFQFPIYLEPPDIANGSKYIGNERKMRV